MATIYKTVTQDVFNAIRFLAPFASFWPMGSRTCGRLDSRRFVCRIRFAYRRFGTEQNRSSQQAASRIGCQNRSEVQGQRQKNEQETDACIGTNSSSHACFLRTDGGSSCRI